jgi:ribosomal-protein-alanine N-acetyltransferase
MMTNPFEVFPSLNTQRLFLRELQTEDAEQVLFLRSNKEVTKFIKRQIPTKIQDAVDFIDKIQLGYSKKETINWVICLTDNPKMIGSICLWNYSLDRKTAEVGYDLNPSFQNLGIMTEALQAVLHFGFDTLQLDKIKAFTHYANENSKNLLTKNAFTLVEGETDAVNEDNIIFSINK